MNTMDNDVLDFQWPDEDWNGGDPAASIENLPNRTVTSTLRDLLSTITSNPGTTTDNLDPIVPETPEENGTSIFATLSTAANTEGISTSLPHSFATENAVTENTFDSTTVRKILDNATTTVSNNATIVDQTTEITGRNTTSIGDVISNITTNISETIFPTINSNNYNETRITSNTDILTTESSRLESTFGNIVDNVTQSIHELVSTTTEKQSNESTEVNHTTVTIGTTSNSSQETTTFKNIVDNFTALFTEPDILVSEDSNSTFITSTLTNMTTEGTTLLTRDTFTTKKMFSSFSSTIPNVSTDSTTTKTIVDKFTYGISEVFANAATKPSILSKPNNHTMHETFAEVPATVTIVSTNRPDVTTIFTSLTSTTEKLAGSHNYDSIETAQDITMYIIIGVLLAFLIIALTGLYLFYRIHKKRNTLSGNYYVTELHDTSSSNNKSNNSIIEKKGDSGV